MAVLYRKYRPKKFSEVVGQDHITTSLLSALNSGQPAHAYLFVGPKGTGKTTTARILAKSLNCEKYQKGDKFGEPCGKCVACTSIDTGSWLDLIEIDAASNRTIDDVRELRERIKLSPTSGRYKVYIIDEVHMLTTEAFNALLKTLEEPPAHAFFILCTTEAAKVPPTIVSRTQRFNFKKAGADEIKGVLSEIAKKENITVDDKTLVEIASAADGGYRDALSLFDQVWGGRDKIEHDEAMGLLSSGGGKLVALIVTSTMEGKLNKVFESIDRLMGEGVNFRKVNSEILEFLRRVMLAQTGVEPTDYSLGDEAKETAEKFSKREVLRLMRLVMEMDSYMRTTPIASLPLEMAAASYVVDLPQKSSEVQEDTSAEAGKKKVNEPVVETQAENFEATVEIKEEAEPEKEIEVEVKAVTAEPIEAVDLDAVLSKWNDILESLKPNNLSIVALLRGTKPVSYSGNTITLEAFYKFHKDKLEEIKVLTLVESVIGKALGQNIRVVCRMGKRQALAVDNAEVVNDDLAQLASEIFAN